MTNILAFSDLHAARSRAAALVEASAPADLVIAAGDFCNHRQGLSEALALLDGAFQFVPWFLCTLGLLLAHATNNLLNDYTDSRRGIDSGNYFRNQYGAHVLEDGRSRGIAEVDVLAQEV